jgi:hypothetical protein
VDQEDGHELDRNGEPTEDPWPCLLLSIAFVGTLLVLAAVIIADMLGPG